MHTSSVSVSLMTSTSGQIPNPLPLDDHQNHWTLYICRRDILNNVCKINSSTHVVVYPLPWPLLVGGVRCSRLWSTSQLLRPSGQQCSHSGGVCPQHIFHGMLKVIPTRCMTKWDSLNCV